MKKIIAVIEMYNVVLIGALLVVGMKNSSTQLMLISTILFIPLLTYFLLRLHRRISFLHKIVAIEMYGPEKLLAMYGFVFCSLLFIALALSFRTPLELFLGIFLLPVELYFIGLIFKKLIKIRPQKAEIIKPKKGVVLPTRKTKKKGATEVEEKDRRAFLKIVAGAGFGFLITSVMNPSRAGAAFFGSVPGPGVIGIKDSGGTKIDPSIKSPTDGYGIMNTDTSSAPFYYGFVNKDGAWYIVKEVGDGSFLYAKGNSGYNWSNRASESYASFSATF